MNPWILAAAVVLTATPDAGGKASVPTPTDAALVSRVRQLPNVSELARKDHERSGGGRDVYAIEEELAAKLAAEKKTFVRLVVYRTFVSCSTGAHRMTRVNVIISDHSGTGAPRSLAIREDELHDVEQHGATLTGEQRSFLVSLPER